MMLGAVRDGKRVDVGTLPQGVRWKHVSVTDINRIDDVYTTADADPAGFVDGAGTKWMDRSVYADVTLTSRAPATEVPGAFLIQDKLLCVSLTMRNLSDAKTAAIRAVPGMERAHIQSAKDTRSELQTYGTADPPRWQEVKGHMANTLPPQADLFWKKLRASTWEDTKPLVAETGHYPPTKGMKVEGQKTMIMVAIHAATARLQGRDRVSRVRGAGRALSKKRRRRRKNARTQMPRRGFSPRLRPPGQGESQPGRPTAADSPGRPRRNHACK